MYLSTPLGNSRCVAVEKSNNLQAKIMQSQIFVFFMDLLPLCRVCVQLEKRSTMRKILK